MQRPTISLIVLLVAFWLLNSGMIKSLVLFMGLGSVLLVLYLSGRMNVVDREGQPFHMSARLPSYYLWLMKELVVSNVDVVRRIWSGNHSISPAMATVPVHLHSDIGRVIYANSVTLTPGTVAIDIDENSMMVHALVKESITSLRTGDMEERVSRLEE